MAALEHELKTQLAELASLRLQPVPAVACTFKVADWSSRNNEQTVAKNRPQHVLDHHDLSDNSYWCAMENPAPNFIAVEFETETKLHSIKYVSKRWHNSGCPKVLHVIDHDTGATIHVARALPDAQKNKNVTHEVQLPIDADPAKKIRLEASQKHGKWFCFVSLEFRGWGQQDAVARKAVEQAHIAGWSNRLEQLAAWNCAIPTGVIAEAAKAGDATAVRSMLSQGGDPDGVSTFSHPDGKPRTGLQWAAEHGHGEVVAALLKGEAAVDLACRNYSGERGVTPLMIAAYRGHGLVVSQLLAAGASISAKSSSETTALGWAKRAQSHECVAVLEAWEHQ
eukprot:COSAG03_NODE_1120_length_4775_cov_5.192044_3_plen_338_part_00